MPARSYDARHRAYDARHRSSNRSTRKPRRLFAGLALPTAAATALTFTATGAAMASSNHSFTGSKNTAPTTSQSALSVPLGDSSTEARQANALAREHAAFTAARSSERQDIAARNKAAKLEERAAKLEERAHSWELPMKTCVRTSSFGWRWGRLHAGEDFAAGVGTNLVSMSTGTVTFAGPESGYGNIVKIRYWDGTITFYGHMSRVSVTQGEGVKPGEVVGQSGNTGESTGPHLHLEVHPGGGAAVDPLPWLAGHQIPA